MSVSTSRKDIYGNVGDPRQVRHILIEPTNVCNHGCIFCHNGIMQAERGLMKREVWETAIQQAYEYGIRDVGFFLRGEPLLHPRLKDMVQMAKDLGYYSIHTVTNGSLATPEKIIPLIDAGLTGLVFSVNAGNACQYMRIHQRDDFEKVIGNIRLADQYRNDNGMDVSISLSYIVIDENELGVEQLRERVSACIDEFLVMPAGNQGGYSNHIAPNLVQSCHRYISVPCGLPFNRVHVTWDGLVSACCVDFDNKLVMGDITRNSFAEIWEGDAYKAIRNMHLSRELRGQCRICIAGQTDGVLEDSVR